MSSSLAGTALGDLFVFGDIRDAVREGSRYAHGETYDELVLGLACVGIALTAGTYASFGAATPARVGLSVVKAARKTGKLGGPMAAWVGRSLREVVDWSALRRGERLGGRARGRGARGARGGQGREGRRADQADRRRRPGAGQGRHQGGARRPEDRAQSGRGGARLPSSPRRRAARPARSSRRSAAARSCCRSPRSIWRCGFSAPSPTLFGFVSSAKAGVERMT